MTERYYIDDNVVGDDFLTPTERAQSAFSKRASELGDSGWEGIAQEAWQNAFSVETYREYVSDLERWTVALATLEMLADR